MAVYLFFSYLRIHLSSNIAGHCSNVWVIFYTLNHKLEIFIDSNSIKVLFLACCIMIVFLCFLFVQIASLKGLLSAAALGVHASWVCLIEVAFGHKDTSQPNPNTIHIYVSPSSSGFRQSQWGSLSQAWSCMSSCGGAVQFLFLVSFLFLDSYFFIYLFSD